MESIYTTSVSNVPDNYNDPTPAYKKHVWIAVSGILAFFGFYLFISYWFLSSAFRLLMDATNGGNSSLVSIGVGIGSLFLGIFMVKAFFFVQTKYDVQDHQIKPEDEPLLFDFLHKLADEIGAPRPNKVYLSNRVNASVFYDLTLLNLFFPSKKNLEIGLGLINVLNLGEFKAVLAHEFGHFAQKSMLVGRWVYIANQIANTIISKRDALDSFLSGLSRIDIRIAWIGWILSIIVWSIRSLVELIFRVVVLSQRALSREMEFQADLVAVSVTGSDALIHALHKLQAADAALSDAMGSLEQQLNKGKAIEDLYAIQSNAIEKTAYILNDEEYGKSPKVPTDNPESHRVFSDKIAQPPKMWLTHPPDQEREANAKQKYISGEIDNRSAWDLFNAPNQLRLQMTKELIATAKVETELISTSDALSVHDKQFSKSYFNPNYRGVYLNRFFCQEYDSSSSIYLPNMTLQEALEAKSKLYPTSLVEEIEDFTTLQEEMLQLEAIKDKRLSATGDSGIWHRGLQIRRRELPKVVDGLKSEVAIAQSKVTDHDREVRTVHLRLAEKIGLGWDGYLTGLLSIVHYCEHNIANINDAQRSLSHVLNVVMADNQVSAAEMRKLVYESDEVYKALHDVHAQQEHITFDQNLIKELELEEGQTLFEEFKFPRANESNMNSWLTNIDGWIGSYLNSLSKLRAEALELLLRSEEQVMEMTNSQQTVAAPVPPSSINTDYTILTPGNEREIKIKLTLWDKFISADGIIPAITKFAVAASIVGSTLYYTGHTGVSDLTIYNGLGQAVEVNVNGSNVFVAPHSHQATSMTQTKDIKISTKTVSGQTIESFSPEASRSSSHYVYNVANASVLAEYRVYYGQSVGDYEINHGNKRWITSKADYLFEDAPETLSTSSSGTTKDVLMGISNENPAGILSVLQDSTEQINLIKSHLRWDPPHASNAIQWVGMASLVPAGIPLLENRLKSYPDEIITMRALMDSGDEARKKNVCETCATKSNADPENVNAFYIAARCIEDNQLASAKYLEGIKKWPDHGWMNFAASYHFSKKDNWQKSYNALIAGYPNADDNLKPIMALNALRVSRLIKAQGKSVTNEQTLESDYIAYYKSLELGIDKNPYIQIYYLLHKGELQKAVDLSSKTPEVQSSILAICAASDGATKEMIDTALKLSPDSLNKLGTYGAVGLRLRKNMDISTFEKALTEIATQEEYDIMAFINKVKSKDFKGADMLLKDVGYISTAELYSLAYIALGDKIPSDWKLKAKTLLFPSEKPYIK